MSLPPRATSDCARAWSLMRNLCGAAHAEQANIISKNEIAEARRKFVTSKSYLSRRTKHKARML